VSCILLGVSIPALAARRPNARDRALAAKLDSVGRNRQLLGELAESGGAIVFAHRKWKGPYDWRTHETLSITGKGPMWHHYAKDTYYNISNGGEERVARRVRFSPVWQRGTGLRWKLRKWIDVGEWTELSEAGIDAAIAAWRADPKHPRQLNALELHPGFSDMQIAKFRSEIDSTAAMARAEEPPIVAPSVAPTRKRNHPVADTVGKLAAGYVVGEVAEHVARHVVDAVTGSNR
jgi:hypothetical protein